MDTMQLPLLDGIHGILNGHLKPSQLEKALAAEGIGPVIAVDEAGRGPLAGPVIAAAVVFEGVCAVRGVKDSKQLTPGEREALEPKVKRAARAWAVGVATAEEIDRINILEATRLATMRAIEGTGVIPAVVLTDALTLPRLNCPVMPIIRGDAQVRAIGAASIIAKTCRDRLMKRLSKEWPQYGFNLHFGYATEFHFRMIGRHGASTLHRLTFDGVMPNCDRPLVISRFFAKTESAIACCAPEELGRHRWRVLRRQVGWFPQRECGELIRRCAAH